MDPETLRKFQHEVEGVGRAPSSRWRASASTPSGRRRPRSAATRRRARVLHLDTNHMDKSQLDGLEKYLSGAGDEEWKIAL